jgi:hypothetical protein
MTAAPAGAGKKLRIGLLIDSDSQPAWIRQLLAQLHGSAFAEIALIIERPAEARRGLRAGRLLYDAYLRLDRHLGGRATALAEGGLRALLPACPRLLLPRAPGPGDAPPEEPSVAPPGALSEADLGLVRACDLDVLLRLGPRSLEAGLLAAARSGVWSHRGHADLLGDEGVPAGFFAVLRGKGTTSCALQVRAQGADGRVRERIIDRVVARTLPGSVRQNGSNLLWTAAGLAPRRLEALWRTGHIEAGGGKPWPDGDAASQVPGNREMARGLLALAAREGRRRLRGLFYVQERQLAYRLGPDADLGAAPLRGLRDLTPPPGAFWADPCAVSEGGRHHVFFEEFVYAQRKGRISVLTLDDEGPCGPPRVVLEGPQHLSYPFLLESGGERYLIPETHRRRTIELYRARRFPDEWALDAVLLTGVEAVDATLHEEGGRFYLFFATRAPGALDFDELHVRWADALRGPYRPVGNSPVKCDVRSSRPAGALLRIGGRLYRPAQVGAPRYGRAIALCEVLHLGPDRYEERVVQTLAPDWRPDLVGTHTLHHGAGLTLVDAFYEIGRLERMLRRWKGLWRPDRLRRLRRPRLPAPLPLGGQKFSAPAGAPRAIFPPCETPSPSPSPAP